MTYYLYLTQSADCVLLYLFYRTNNKCIHFCYVRTRPVFPTHIVHTSNPDGFSCTKSFQHFLNLECDFLFFLFAKSATGQEDHTQMPMNLSIKAAVYN